MFIRKRISPTQRQTPSYQVIETFREGGRVRQRVLANLGPYPSIAEALERARHDLVRSQARIAMCERGFDDAGRRISARERVEAPRRLARAEERVRKLERVAAEPVERTT